MWHSWKTKTLRMFSFRCDFCENVTFIFFVQLAQRRYIRTLEPYMEEAEPEYLRLQQQFREILQCARGSGSRGWG